MIYILDVDRTHPLGKVLTEYGNYKWMNGFIIGLCLGSTMTWAILSKKR
jgi:hypothetical protein